MPKMHMVESSCVEAVGYDPKTMDLYVRFLESGKTYIYFDVEASVFKDFMQAESKGKYFQKQVREDYAYMKL